MHRSNRFPEPEAADLAVLKQVIRFGWLATDQIACIYELPTDDAVVRISKLCSRSLLIRDPRRLAVGGSIYTHTRTGARVAGLGIGDDPINDRWVYHHLTVNDVANALLREDKRARWLTERELLNLRQRQARHEGWSDNNHIPDGELITSIGRRIAIEVELNDKDWIRYVDICRWYGDQFGFHALRWYVAVPSLHQRLKTLMWEHGLTEDMDMTVHDLPPGVEVRHK
jgi:hypothetical protein